jgi:hypothetical protein
MHKPDELFSSEEMMRFEAVLKRHIEVAAKVPLLILMTLLAGLALAVVGYSEYEIVYRVFDYLAGDNSEYWSPTLMGFTAATMIIGFHILAKAKPQNLAVRIVDRSVEILIPTYLIGMGFLIACILFADGLGSMIQIEMPAMIGSLPEAIEQGWVDAIFAHVTNPLAVLAFSLGIGGLAIVNIFIAHKLLTTIAININDIFGRLSRARAAIKDHQAILKAQKEYSALNYEINDLHIMDDNYIRTIITNEVISAISDALLPHKKWLQDSQYSTEFRFEDSHRKVDPKQVAKDIAKIEAIRPQDIMNAMNPKILEKGK